MNNLLQILTWGTDYLISNGYNIQSQNAVVETPWSIVIRFSTSKGDVYLKQMPAVIAREPMIFQILANQFQAKVPHVMAINDELHCFLMLDAGLKLRDYLKNDFQPNLLSEALKVYTALQRSTENDLEPFFALGVPDWRVNKLPELYEQMISQEALLKEDGLSDKELQELHDLSSQFSKQCELLSQYQIPATLNIYDINTNNILIDPHSKKMTCIDLGEAVITHPFFSLHTYLYQASLHHSVKESDEIYLQLQEACLEKWLDVMARDKLLEAFMLTKQFWPVYSVLSSYRLINIIGLEAFKSFYANRPNRLTNFLKEHIQVAKANLVV
jgi:hypothetical protein